MCPASSPSPDPDRALYDARIQRFRTAVHEAGHAMAAMLARVAVESMRINTPENPYHDEDSGEYEFTGGHTRLAFSLDGGLTMADFLYVSPLDDYTLDVGPAVLWRDEVTLNAAGEWAELRWLRQEGLWTRAVDVDVSLDARNDHDKIIATLADLDPPLRFVTVRSDGPGVLDLPTVHTWVAQRLSPHWDRLLELAGALDRAGTLNAARIAAASGVRNPYLDYEANRRAARRTGAPYSLSAAVADAAGRPKSPRPDAAGRLHPAAPDPRAALTRRAPGRAG
ncbi:hypothetical protein [Marinactinospora rubrisoli]|uniref:Peptidase M41 domain-containing protein n=1 Tax=Marinactinospora rubrisoli TaxID=2715399 RepID=A0ABW2KAP8_9ACTN